MILAAEFECCIWGLLRNYTLHVNRTRVAWQRFSFAVIHYFGSALQGRYHTNALVLGVGNCV